MRKMNAFIWKISPWTICVLVGVLFLHISTKPFPASEKKPFPPGASEKKPATVEMTPPVEELVMSPTLVDSLNALRVVTGKMSRTEIGNREVWYCDVSVHNPFPHLTISSVVIKISIYDGNILREQRFSDLRDLNIKPFGVATKTVMTQPSWYQGKSFRLTVLSASYVTREVTEIHHLPLK